jgi:hypothetical protein
MAVLRSDPTHASIQAFERKSYVLHYHAPELKTVDNSTLEPLRTLYDGFPSNGRRLVQSIGLCSIQDRGHEVMDRGFQVDPFTRSDLAEVHRRSSPKCRLFPQDDKQLKLLEQSGFLHKWKRLLQREMYRGADDTILYYSAPYEYNYILTPSAAVLVLLKGPHRDRLVELYRHIVQ